MGHPSPALFLTEGEDAQLATIQSNIQRVIVLTFALGLPDSLWHSISNCISLGKRQTKKVTFFFPGIA